MKCLHVFLIVLLFGAVCIAIWNVISSTRNNTEENSILICCLILMDICNLIFTSLKVYHDDLVPRSMSFLFYTLGITGYVWASPYLLVLGNVTLLLFSSLIVFAIMLIQVQDAVELCRKPVNVVNTGVDQPTRAFNEKCSG